ncbi:Deoxyhypusine synthase [Porphyridium purpureum]|uniref:deoxyhypusine synthase n=1 Tax=Porphyridium purpureum TaxID=35688 RepID=A0A5J4Z141_PORPP|nr:Deoxyhypusine synthase [Porphyridium purpureum]|eukprot:POR1912..scf208_2
MENGAVDSGGGGGSENGAELEQRRQLQDFEDHVLKRSVAVDSGTYLSVQGVSIDDGIFAAGSVSPDRAREELLRRILDGYERVGFQATHFARACKIVTEMLNWRPPAAESTADPAAQDARCTIFLGFTSNLVSSGLRESIRFLVQHKLVDVIVSTAGGVEEDLIKCLAPTYVADFNLSGVHLRKQGMNRIGNLLVPNDNYCKFEEWFMPILDELLAEQRLDGEDKHVWTPSSIIKRLGERINNESSIVYWAARNNIPIFCPALTDGSMGDMIFFHSIKSPGLVIDIVQDIHAINKRAMKSSCTGCVILGAGLVKHHICNANLMRNGTDYAVYINTSNEFDGSDAGASPDEAVSWGKLRADANMVKVHADASLIFPLLVAQSFFRYWSESERPRSSTTSMKN